VFFFLPIGVEEAEVNRVPFVSATIAALCVVLFAVTWVLPADPMGAGEEDLQALFKAWQERPYLTPPPLLASLLPKQAQDAIAEEAEAPDDEAELALEQAELNGMAQTIEAKRDSSWLRRGALVPAHGMFQWGWLLHMFLHFGWMHLLGNLLFFYLVGPLLEDIWGRFVFPAFYLVGGGVAALAHFALNPGSDVSMAGASGAIAACMGAFAVRFARRNIRFAYFATFAFKVFKGTRLVPAWVWGLFWFGSEVLDFFLKSDNGVAVMAHIGGFAFGAAVAIVLKASGIERKYLEPSVERTHTKIQHPSLQLGIEAQERGELEQARRLYTEVLSSEPDHEDALVGLALVELAVGDKASGLRRAERVLMKMSSSGRTEDLARLVRDLGTHFDPEALSPSAAFKVAEVLEHGPGDLSRWVEPLLLRGASAGGPLALKCLMRAAELRLAAREGEAALELLQSIPKGVDPSREQRSRRLELEEQARRYSGEVALEVRTDPPKPQGPVGPEEAARIAPRILAGRLLHLGGQILEVELDQGERKSIPLDKVVAVAVGVTPDNEADRQRNVLVTDVVLSWGSSNMGPLIIRLPSHGLRLHELFPGKSARQAYFELLGQLLEKTGATALPDRQKLTRGEFPMYSSMAALEAVYYPRA
jgi:membrane associated rhomboid family serine protease